MAVRTAIKPKLEPTLFNSRHVAEARGEDSAPYNTFALYAPPPGTLPADKPTMANDDALSTLFAFTGALPFIGQTPAFLGYGYLSELAQRSEYRRPAEVLAEEMTREWGEFRGVGDKDKSAKIALLDASFAKFKVKEIFRDLAEKDGLFGRAHLYFDTGDTDNPSELRVPLMTDKRKVGLDKLLGIRVIEPFWVYPTNYEALDPLKPDFYRPPTWYVQGREIHKSRLPSFVLRDVPDILKPVYQFGGLSLTQMIKPYVDNWLRTRQSVSDLVHSYSVTGISTNMASTLASGGQAALNNRANVFNAMRDSRGLMQIDKDTEEFWNVSTPLTTLDHLQAQAQEQMASACGIPLVKLLGITPSGLNASTDGEIRTFYDTIAAMQERFMLPMLEYTSHIIQLSEFGEIDPDVTFKFKPLWQMDAAAEAAMRKTNAETHEIYCNLGAVDAEVVREVLAADQDSVYQGIDLSGPAPGPPAMGEMDADGEEDDDKLPAGGEATSGV